MHCQVGCLHSTLENEIEHLNFLLHDLDDAFSNQDQEVSSLHEKIRICSRVNTTRCGQIKVRVCGMDSVLHLCCVRSLKKMCFGSRENWKFCVHVKLLCCAFLISTMLLQALQSSHTLASQASATRPSRD